MKLFSDGHYSVYVYPEGGEPHHLPHCHVRWAKGDTILALPTLIVLAGHRLPRSGRRLLREQLDEICAGWDSVNLEVKVYKNEQ